MPFAMRQYVALALLFAATVWVQAGSIGNLIRVLRHGDEIAAEPFAITNATRTIANGPFHGDQVLAINGRPFNAELQYSEAVAAARPGDTLRFTLSEPGGGAVERTVVLPSIA